MDKLPPIPSEKKNYTIYLICFLLLFLFSTIYLLKDCFFIIPSISKMTSSQKLFLQNTTPSLLKKPDFTLTFSQDHEEAWVGTNFVYRTLFEFCFKSEKVLEEPFSHCITGASKYRFIKFTLDKKIPEGYYEIELKSSQKEKEFLKKFLGFDEDFFISKKIFFGESKEIFEKKFVEKLKKRKVTTSREEERFLTLKSLITKLEEDFKKIFTSKESLKNFKNLYEKNYAPLFTHLITDLKKEDPSHFLIPVIEKLALNSMKFYHEIKDVKKNKNLLLTELITFFENVKKDLE